MERVADIGRERYISITTFRRDESPVATPVWVVADSDHLYVWTVAQTGKAKRIRHNPAVTIEPCTARGASTGPAMRARAQIVPSASRPQIWPLFLAKYRLQLRAIIWSRKISGLRRRGRPPVERVFLELTLTDE
jgi:PPOX class probable F420-dependent enzyme